MKGRAAAFVAVDLDIASVSVDRVTRDREAIAAFTPLRPAALVEGLEDMRQVLSFDSNAVVADPQVHVGLVDADLQLDAVAIGLLHERAAGIVDQLVDDI